MILDMSCQRLQSRQTCIPVTEHHGRLILYVSVGLGSDFGSEVNIVRMSRDLPDLSYIAQGALRFAAIEDQIYSSVKTWKQFTDGADR